MRISNVHRRVLAAPPDAVAALLATVGSADDQLWPGDSWPRMRFDGALVPGAEGGHGPVRYRLTERAPQRRVAFTFVPRGLAAGLRGGHRFELAAAPNGAVLSHVLEAECAVGTAMFWGAIIRPLHDALIEDALDRAERTLTGAVAVPRRWSPWVRLLRRVLRRPRPLAAPVHEACRRSG